MILQYFAPDPTFHQERKVLIRVISRECRLIKFRPEYFYAEENIFWAKKENIGKLKGQESSFFAFLAKTQYILAKLSPLIKCSQIKLRMSLEIATEMHSWSPECWQQDIVTPLTVHWHQSLLFKNPYLIYIRLHVWVSESVFPSAVTKWEKH